jgi:uncharacterized coiled-coil DUF342 family protein
MKLRRRRIVGFVSQHEDDEERRIEGLEPQHQATIGGMVAIRRAAENAVWQEQVYIASQLPIRTLDERLVDRNKHVDELKINLEIVKNYNAELEKMIGELLAERERLYAKASMKDDIIGRLHDNTQDHEMELKEVIQTRDNIIQRYNEYRDKTIPIAVKFHLVKAENEKLKKEIDRLTSDFKDLMRELEAQKRR